MSELFKSVEWSRNTNIYEVNLRQYTQDGTLQAFMKEMPRLKDMGIEVLWFMPLTPISKVKRLGTLGSYYACSDYTAINPEFGSSADFKQLVKLAHELNFKVMIDWVANHTGYDHKWTIEHPEYYRRNHDGNFFDQHGWEDVIDLNYDNTDLHTAMIDAMQFWIDEYDIDGFRCDMAMLVPITFWIAARTKLDRVKDLFWLAECEEINYHDVFDATYSWKFLHKMEAFWRHQTDLRGIEEVLHYYETMFPPSAFHLLFTTNHDENSHSGSEFERMGNAAIPFSVLCCTWKGIPLIYSGQELPNLKRLKFFDKDFIEWTGTNQLQEFFKKLLALRKNNGALQAGENTSVRRLGTNADYAVFSFSRQSGKDEVLVMINFSHDQQTFTYWEESAPVATFKDLFSGQLTDIRHDTVFTLAPWDYKVLERSAEAQA
jgi:glycosidase